MNLQAYDRPFWHATITDCLPLDLAIDCVNSLPPKDAKSWVSYSSPFESGKRTCRDPEYLSGPILRAMSLLSDSHFVGILRRVADMPGLIPAPFNHGGGIHVMHQGGHLDPHLDFAMHPECEFLERRLSLILYLTASDPADGGELCLWDDTANYVEQKIAPKFNQAVLFANSDISYHSVSKLTGAGDRVSLAMYYCAPIRPGVMRKRALWVPIRT